MVDAILKRIEELREKIRKYDILYYAHGISEITDEEYDKLYHELQKLEEENPHYKSPDSPTQRVGSDLTKEFPKVHHSSPMISIENTYREEEIREWLDRIKREIPEEKISFVGELKMDGVAVALIYENGRLVRGITRGDGVIGDDVTPNVKTIKAIPLKVDYKEPFEVRGEIYMTFEAFTKLNERLVENGERPMQNPRNTTAGTLKLQDSSEVARRKLSFAAHYLISKEHRNTQYENLSFLNSIGFPTVVHSKELFTFDNIWEFCDEWKTKRHSLPFPVDGVVIKVNQINSQEKLGTTAKSWRWVIAYKYKAERAETIVEKIDAGVGRTGVVTPVARLKPVFLAGTTIKNATLHNYDEIKRLDIREGDYVEIEKGGEIIPKVVRVIIEKRNTQLKPFNPPKHCPACGSPLCKLEGEVAIRCLNSSCPAQIFALLEHFVSRSAMDIRNLGPALLSQLLDKGLVKSIADIYTLKEEQLIPLERMGEKSAKKVIASIEESKKNPLDRLIHGLGIRMIGAQAAKIITDNIKDISDLFTITKEELTSIDGIGPTMAESIRMYFDREENRKLVERLRQLGLNMKGCGGSKKEGIFSGKTFVLTGTLTNFTREEAQKEIEKRGGKVTSSVSSKTDFVVVGENPGSKFEKAKKLEVKIVDEKEFLNMLSQ